MERERRLVHEGGLEGLPEVAQVLHRLGALADQRVRTGLGALAERGKEEERRAQGREVPRRGHPEGHAAREPGQVADPLESLTEIGQERRRLHQGGDGVEPLPDLARPEERPEEPLTEQPPAHRRPGAVHRPEERGDAAAVLQALDQLQVPRRALVQGEMVLQRQRLDPGEVCERRLLSLLEVAERRPGGAKRPAPAGQAEALDRGHAEMGAQAILRLAEAEARGIARGHGDARRGQPPGQGVVGRNAWRKQHLRGPPKKQRLGQTLDVGRLTDPEVGGRDVHQGDPEVVRPPPERRQEVVEAPVEEPRLGDGPRRDEPDHLPPDQLPPLGRRRLDLIADRNLQPRPDEPRQVDVEGVVRHPGHRDLLPRGERDVERAGRHGGVLVERLVEVAEAEEQDVVRIAPLPLVVLAHHRRQRGVHHGRIGRWHGRIGRWHGRIGRWVPAGSIRDRPGPGARDVVAHQGAR